MPEKDLKPADFKYVDVWYSDANGKPSPWKRIALEEVAEFQQKEALNFNCFASVQRFANKTKGKKGDIEACIAPLYFDLDYAEDPGVTKGEALKLIDFFTQELDLQPTDIWLYFSGSKGFHILVASDALGIEAREDLQKVFKYVAGYLKFRLGDNEKDLETGDDVLVPLKSVDLVVYTCPRMLRLPNSVHQKTRLFKVELTIDELRNLSLDQIKDLAKQPRRNVGPSMDERREKMAKRPKAAEFYRNKREEYEQAAATAESRDKEEYVFTKEAMPVCVQDILHNGWKKEGDRNQATVQLSAYMKDAGYTREETNNILEDWVAKFTSAKTYYAVQQRKANTRNVVESVYNGGEGYRFGCAFIRSLHGEKTPGSKEYDRVPCAGELCQCIRRSMPKEEEAIPLHLADTGDARYNGKLIRTKIMVAGKKSTPFIVPKRIEYSCWGREKCKKSTCPLYNIHTGTAYKDLAVYDRELILMCGIGDDNIRGILKELGGIVGCSKYDYAVVETTNVDELLVIPMADDNRAAIDFDDTSGGRYVLRKIYAVGSAKLNENKYYEITGYVFPHPKNQEGTIIINTAEPLQDVVDRFELTDEVKENLARTFAPENHTVAAIQEKLTVICDDITYNVTHIVQRDEALVAILLVYHSVLRFKVPWDLLPIRGWLECAVIGDTGTGKSALIDKTMTYAGLGARVNAESTSRTGLTYKMEQNGSGGNWYIVWGAWPLADKEMIWIDEMTGIEKEEYGEMTAARSEGKLEVKRAVTAETPCRVRAVLSGNVPFGKRLADYGQGVEGLKDIFNNEDIRRFDFGVFMRSTDVDPELYNQKLQEYPRTIEPEALQSSILFAWSRRPDQVIFTADAMDKLLEVSTSLSKIYANATDVPLVSASDQRNKVARLSVALAALLHSVDHSGECIQVWPGHVEYIDTYLRALYNAPGCGLNYYARLAVREEELDETKFTKLTGHLKVIDSLKQASKFMEFISLFAQQKYLRQGDVEAMLSVDRDEAKAIVNQLTKLKMIILTTGGYRKTPRFNSYIAKCFEKGLFDGIEDDL